MKKFFITITILLLPFLASAQEYELVYDASNNIQTLFIDTKGTTINAIDGIIKINSENSSNIVLSNENSIVPIWLTNPSFNGKEIIFEGVLPGGFTGKSLILSFSGGSSRNTISGNIFLNDGLGTSKKAIIKYREATLEEKNILNTISKNIKTGLSSDTIAPEIFYATVGTSTDIFDGKYFISFLTQDKQSGIDHYEIAEKRSAFRSFNYKSLSWQKVDSPYLLNDQELKSYIYVKAVDRAGNERVSIVSPLYTSISRLITIVSTIIILITIIWFVLRKFINDKRNKNFSP